MADKYNTIVSDVITRGPFTGTYGEYFRYSLICDNVEFSTLKKDVIPEDVAKGSKIELIFQEIEGKKGVAFNILSVLKLSNTYKLTEEDLEMGTKITTTGNTKGIQNTAGNKTTAALKGSTGTGDTSDKEMIVLYGTLYYPHLNKPSQMSGKFQVELSIDEDTKAELSTLEIPIQNKGDERGDYVILKSTYAPKVVDIEDQELPPTVLVGNGSTAKVVANIFGWTFQKKSGTSLGLRALKILELKEYASKVSNLLSGE